MSDTMFELVEKYTKEVRDFILTEKDTIETYRLRFISRKSVISELFNEFRNVPNEHKKEFGKKLNELRELVKEKFSELAENSVDRKESNLTDIDLTLPPLDDTLGSLHPLSIVKNRIVDIFQRIGFNVSVGPEIEEDWYNFTALNFPENHPAREMQDTFFIEKNPDVVLRTHTSNVQVRLMEEQAPPIRSIMPGRVYRNEAISARAHCMFHQVEGLYIDTDVSFKNLKDTLYYFSKEMFGKDTKVRFRPSYFPFTEPSAEMDISCFICKSKGCKICKGSGWVEIGGAGMVDPNVLKNAKIDNEKFTGFAFGMGIERITMLKYNVTDIRLFFENDVRFLSQFESA